MIRENLVAERIAIDSYSQMIRYIGDTDTTTPRMLEEILAKEEEHAEDLSDLLATPIRREDLASGERRLSPTEPGESAEDTESRGTPGLPALRRTELSPRPGEWGSNAEPVPSVALARLRERARRPARMSRILCQCPRRPAVLECNTKTSRGASVR